MIGHVVWLVQCLLMDVPVIVSNSIIDSIKFAMDESSRVKFKIFFDKFDAYSSFSEFLLLPTQVIQIVWQVTHAVYHDRIFIAHKSCQHVKRWTMKM